MFHMNMETKITAYYEEQAKQLHTSTRLDERILSNVKQHQMPYRSETMNMKKMYKKAIVLVALIVVLSGFGFGARLLLSDSTDKLTLNYMTSSQFNLDAMNVTEAYLAKEEVNEQLVVGERGVIYFPEMNRDYPLIAVAKLPEENNWNAWSSDIERLQKAVPYTLLDDTFTFTAGLLDDPFYPIIPVLQNELILELEQKKQATADENAVIWSKVNVTEEDYQWKVFTTKYINEEGNEIYVVANLFNDNVIQIDSYVSEDANPHQEVINGKRVTYVNNEQALTSTGKLKSVQWIDDVENGSVMYKIMTEHENISENMLIEAAIAIIPALTE